MSIKRTLKIVAPLAALLAATLHAQVGRGTTEWLTAGGDAQRTFWIRTDPKISVTSMSQPGFERQWSTKLDNRTRGANGLQHGVSANGVTLFVPMSIVAGSSNNIYALDNDIGYVVWQRQFDAPLPAATAQCPGGITAGATRIVPLVPPAIGVPGASGGRAAQSYRSVIGEPGQGVPLEGRGGRGPGGPPAAGAPPATPPAGAPAGAAPAPVPPPGGANPQQAPGGAAPQRGAGAPGRQGGGGGRGAQGPGIPGAPETAGGGGLGRPSGVVYALSSDGMLHVLGLPSGKDIQKPAPFVPANATWTDTIAVNTTLYATTAGSCGGAPNAVWAIDLASPDKPVVSWKSDGGPIVGRLAFATDGTVYAAIGPGTATGSGKVNAIVSLDPKTLQVKDWFTQAGVEFVTGPTIFKHDDRDVVAAATKDGRVILLNATSLGGSDHATALHASSALATGIAANALATWQEMTIAPPPAAAAAPPAGPAGGPAQPNITYGARWILAATTTGVTALKLTDSGGSPSLQRGWTAQGLTGPETPIVVNGVVFALSSGRSATAAGRGTAAVLRAYDGTSGKELWTSGKAMTAPASPGSFWSALSQIYVGTNDGSLHAFGFLDERR